LSDEFNDKDTKIQYFKTPVDLSTYTADEFVSDKKSHKKIVIVGVSAFVLIALLFYTGSFMQAVPQDTDSAEIDPKSKFDKYNVGQLGSDHAHAAIAVFINGERVDFAQESFQLKSKYIHFENHNSYQIHRHATNVPFEILFDSIGLEISNECVTIYSESYCTDSELKPFVNEKPHQDIASYVTNHKDRILISLGESDISGQLEYLKSLPIYGLPKEAPKDNSVYV